MNEIVDQLPQFINNDIKILWKYFFRSWNKTHTNSLLKTQS